MTEIRPCTIYLFKIITLSLLILSFYGCKEDTTTDETITQEDIGQITEETGGQVESIAQADNEKDILSKNINSFSDKVDSGPHYSKKVKCYSKKETYKKCKLSKINQIAMIELVEEKTDNLCSGNYGITEDKLGIYVDKGCQATFNVVQNRSHYLNCKSKNLLEKICQARGNILSYELSSTFDTSKDCIKGESYKLVSPNSILVKNGCQAKFLVETDNIIIISNNEFGWDSLSPRGATGIELDEYLNIDFNPYAPILEEISFNNNGIGVKGGDIVPNQINYNPELLTTEGIVINLKVDTLKARIHVSNLFQTERSGERGKVFAYDENYNLVSSKVLDNATLKFNSTGHQGHTTIKSLVKFRYLVFIALPYLEQNDILTDSSDYFIRRIAFDY